MLVINYGSPCTRFLLFQKSRTIGGEKKRAVETARPPQIRTNVFLRTLDDHAREESKALTVTPQTDGREDVGCALAIKGYPRPSPHLRPSALHCSFTFLISGGLGHQRDVPAADGKSFLKCLRCSV